MTKLVRDKDYSHHINGWDYVLIRPQSYASGIQFPKEVKHEFFTISKKGLISVNKGYAWDGATGGLDTVCFMRGSLYHDILCQSIEEGLIDKSYRRAADKLLYRILGEDGMLGIRRLWVYSAIRLYVKCKY